MPAEPDIHAEDRRLLEAGDHARLFAKYRPLVLTWTKRQLARDLHDHAEDVCQLVLLRLFRELRARRHLGAVPYRDKHGVPIPFRVVVARVTKHETAGYAQRLLRGPRPDETVGDEPNPIDDAETWLARADVRAALAQLPEQARRVCELALLEDMAAADIAQRLAITPNNVYQRLHQGTKRLQEILDAY